MASVKHRRVQIIGLLEDQDALQATLREISFLTIGAQQAVSTSTLLFLQEATVPTAREAELVGILEGLACAFSISDPPEGTGRFGKRKKATEMEAPLIQNVDKVTARMLEVTEQKIKDIQAETDQLVSEISAEYDKEAEAAYWKQAVAGKEAIDQTAQGLADIAAMESKKQVLEFKRELVEKAFDLALGRLGDLSEEKYVKLLANLCVKATESGRERLIFSPRDRGHYGKRVTMLANEMLEEMGRIGNLTMSEETREIRGGVVLTDGQIDVNCSIEALVDAHRRALIIPVSEMLFEKEAVR